MASSKPRLINSIRCSACLDFRRNEIPEWCDFVECFPSNFRLDNIAERFFLKLRELDFKLIGFSEIHVHFFPASIKGPVFSLSDGVHLWKRDVYVGLNAEEWQRSTDIQNEQVLIQMLAETCRYVSTEDKHERVDAAEKSLLEKGESLEIQVFEKDMKTYNFRVTCKVPSNKEKITSKVRYKNKKTSVAYETDFIQVSFFPHLTLLCGTVTVKNQTVTVSPRKHYWTSDFYLRYGTPIRLKIDEMDIVV